MIAVKVDNWNRDLSPWEAPAVFLEERASETVRGAAAISFRTMCGSQKSVLYRWIFAGGIILPLGGISDGYLCRCCSSISVCLVSGFLQYMKEHDMRAKSVYLSLGNREERTRNPLMATVGDCIREGHNLLKMQKIRTIFGMESGKSLQRCRNPDSERVCVAHKESGGRAIMGQTAICFFRSLFYSGFCRTEVLWTVRYLF